jgi:hypothetical protein
MRQTGWFANTLGAEIDLAARATIPRRDKNGNRITEVRRFACGSDFGDPNRSSDPNIGFGVNLTAFPTTAGAAPQSITLVNPVALYIDRIAAGVITDERGNPLPEWFKIVRGVAGRGLMAVLEPPPGATFGLDKVQIVGDPLTHGGQVAEQIQMVLYARTANFGHPAPPLERCVRHCCRVNNTAPVDLVNLAHPAAESQCSVQRRVRSSCRTKRSGRRHGTARAEIRPLFRTVLDQRRRWHAVRGSQSMGYRDRRRVSVRPVNGFHRQICAA